ncbi:MAG: hypothetical protein ACTHMQ_02010 [Protaetiibacter sp.]
MGGVVRAVLAGTVALALVGGPVTAAGALADADETQEVRVETPVTLPPVEEPIPAEVEEPAPAVEEPAPAEVEEAAPAMHLAAAPLAAEDDTTAPVVRVGGLDRNWPYELGAEFVLEFSCEDPESGIVSCTEEHGYQSGDTVRLSIDGLNAFRVTAVNGQGMEWTSSLEIWAQIPEIQDIKVVFDGGRESRNGWFDASITATLRAWRDDELSIREIQYRIDGGEWATAPGAEAQVPFPDEGRHLIEFVAFDADMGLSTLRRQWVNVDLTAPDIIHPDGIDGGVFALGAERGLWMECGDALSGVDVCAFDEGDRLPTDVPGVHTVTARAVDDAGNTMTRTLRYTVLAADGEVPSDDDDDPVGQPASPIRPAVSAPVLASTGADELGLGVLLLAGIGLVGLGAGAAFLTRRSRLSS